MRAIRYPVEEKPVKKAAPAKAEKTEGKKATGKGANERGNKGTSYALETSAGTPSRKSTRKSPGHVKPDSNLRRRATRATRSPKARAARSQAAQR